MIPPHPHPLSRVGARGAEDIWDLPRGGIEEILLSKIAVDVFFQSSYLPLVNYHLPFFIYASQWKMRNESSLDVPPSDV